MSFKSIELQVAIPRTQDLGRMQEQIMKQGQRFQETLTEQQIRDEILKRTQVNESEEVEKGKLHDEEPNHHGEDDKEKSDKEQQKNKSMDHPYLGTKIDFSG